MKLEVGSMEVYSKADWVQNIIMMVGEDGDDDDDDDILL